LKLLTLLAAILFLPLLAAGGLALRGDGLSGPETRHYLS
jgi:hypothetical protein